MIDETLTNRCNIKAIQLVRLWKKKTPFYGRDRPIFSIFLIFLFFFLVCKNYVKSVIFGLSQWKFGTKFLKVTENLFPKFFSKNVRFFGNFIVFREVIFATRKETNLKKTKNDPTDRPYLEGPSTHKTGFLSLPFFFCVCVWPNCNLYHSMNRF